MSLSYWTKNMPVIVEQTNPVFLDYKERIQTLWKIQGRKRTHIFDHELRTKSEITKFNKSIPPVWFNNITLNLIKKIFNLPDLQSFTFLESWSENGDCVITTNDGKNLIIFHDIVSDTFSYF